VHGYIAVHVIGDDAAADGGCNPFTTNANRMDGTPSSAFADTRTRPTSGSVGNMTMPKTTADVGFNLGLGNREHAEPERPVWAVETESFDHRER